MKLLHPLKRQLHRFADRDGTPRELQRIAEHLHGCQRCRNVVQEIRSLGERSRKLEVGEPRPEVWNRVRDTVAGGEVPILPVADPGEVHASWRVPASLAAALMLVARLRFR